MLLLLLLLPLLLLLLLLLLAAAATAVVETGSSNKPRNRQLHDKLAKTHKSDVAKSHSAFEKLRVPPPPAC